MQQRVVLGHCKCGKVACCGPRCVECWAAFRDRDITRNRCTWPRCKNHRVYATGFCTSHETRDRLGLEPDRDGCICGHPHPTRFPMDPPLPEGLADAVTARLEAIIDLRDEAAASRELVALCRPVPRPQPLARVERGRGFSR